MGRKNRSQLTTSATRHSAAPTSFHCVHCNQPLHGQDARRTILAHYNVSHECLQRASLVHTQTLGQYHAAGSTPNIPPVPSHLSAPPLPPEQLLPGTYIDSLHQLDTELFARMVLSDYGLDELSDDPLGTSSDCSRSDDEQESLLPASILDVSNGSFSSPHSSMSISTFSSIPDSVNHEWHHDLPILLREGVASASPNTSREHQFQIRLLQLLNDYGAPLKAYDNVNKLIQHAAIYKCDFTQEFPSRKMLIKDSANNLGMKDLKPRQIAVSLEGGGSVSVTVFDFSSIMVDLFTDHRLVDDLLINWDDPSLPPIFPDSSSKISEIMTGDWYRLTHQRDITHKDQLLAGCMLGIDRAHAQKGGTQRLSLEPVYVSSPLVPYHHRTQPHGWRIIGYINNLSLKSSALRKKSIKNGRKEQSQSFVNYHRILSAVFQSLRIVQNNPDGLRVQLTIPPKDHNGDDVSPVRVGTVLQLRLYFPIVVVIGDFDGHVKLCGFKANTGRFISFDCDCLFQHSDDPDVHCQQWTMARITEIKKNKSTDQLKDDDQSISLSVPSSGNDYSADGTVEHEYLCNDHHFDDDDDSINDISVLSFDDDSSASKDDCSSVTIASKDIRDNLHQLCYHDCDNAFYSLDFGADGGG